jgi:hypothetical protein
MNSSIEMAVKVAVELNQTSESSDTKGRHTSYNCKIRRVLKK